MGASVAAGGGDVGAGTGVSVGSGVGGGSGVAVGLGVAVGSGIAVGSGAAVGSGIGVSAGASVASSPPHATMAIIAIRATKYTSFDIACYLSLAAKPVNFSGLLSYRD